MKEDIESKLSRFNKSTSEVLFHSEKYGDFDKYINEAISGEGFIGEDNYLLLWEKDEIEELNDAYETQEFLSDIILIGSDGGDMAYGINKNGDYIEVPFIGMDDSEVAVVAANFEEFIMIVAKKD